MQQENELYVVYKHTNTINGKMYVGQTCLKPEDRWKNGGKGYKKFWVDENGVKHPSHFWASICKYGWNNFEHKVLIHGLTKSQADFWEKKLIKTWDLMNPQKGYNKKEGGSNGKLSDETKQKISVITKERLKNPENHPFYGKKISTEHKQKISKANKGRCHSKEARKKMSNTRLGKKFSIEHRLKISEANKGRCHSEETKQKLSKTKKEMFANGELKPWNKGKKDVYSEEVRKKISEKLKESKAFAGVNNPRATKVVRLSDNKIYDLIKFCAEDNNLSVDTIRTHCKNRNKTKKQEFMYYTDWLKQQKDEL